MLALTEVKSETLEWLRMHYAVSLMSVSSVWVLVTSVRVLVPESLNLAWPSLSAVRFLLVRVRVLVSWVVVLLSTRRVVVCRVLSAVRFLLSRVDTVVSRLLIVDAVDEMVSVLVVLSRVRVVLTRVGSRLVEMPRAVSRALRVLTRFPMRVSPFRTVRSRAASLSALRFVVLSRVTRLLSAVTDVLSRVVFRARVLRVLWVRMRVLCVVMLVRHRLSVVRVLCVVRAVRVSVVLCAVGLVSRVWFVLTRFRVRVRVLRVSVPRSLSRLWFVLTRVKVLLTAVRVRVSRLLIPSNRLPVSLLVLLTPVPLLVATRRLWVLLCLVPTVLVLFPMLLISCPHLLEK